MIIIENNQNRNKYNAVKILPKSKVSTKKTNKYNTKSTETYKAELVITNPTVICIDEYINAKTKILHKCLVCNYEWFAAPSNILSGRKCPNCRINKTIERTVIPLEKYLERLNKDNSHPIYISGYINMTTPCLHMCRNCSSYFEDQPSLILLRKYCPNCKGKASANKRKKGRDSYKQELKDKNIMVDLVGDYINANIKTLHKCIIHNYIWETTPSRVLQGMGCPVCKSDKESAFHNIGHDGYLMKLKENNIDIFPLETYVSALTPILHHYPCGHINRTSPSNILSGYGCKICGYEKLSKAKTKTQEQYEKELQFKNPLIKVIGEYIGAQNPIELLCLSCGFVWSSKAEVIIRSKNATGCPLCSIPKGEKKISEILKKYNIDFNIQKTYDDLFGVNFGLLSYDFYLPNYNLLIEYQGEQHEHPIEYFGGEEQFKIQQEHDKRKREYAKEHNIDLLEIWYYDYNNIEEILINYLNLETVETVIPA